MKNEIIYWKMKSGKMIDINLMDENHLRNTLKMIVNNSNKHKKRTEFKLNGDMANEFNNTNLSDEYDECDATEIDT
jgi:predicted P-loop ATPase